MCVVGGTCSGKCHQFEICVKAEFCTENFGGRDTSFTLKGLKRDFRAISFIWKGIAYIFHFIYKYISHCKSRYSIFPINSSDCSCSSAFQTKYRDGEWRSGRCLIYQCSKLFLLCATTRKVVTWTLVLKTLALSTSLWNASKIKATKEKRNCGKGMERLECEKKCREKKWSREKMVENWSLDLIQWKSKRKEIEWRGCCQMKFHRGNSIKSNIPGGGRIPRWKSSCLLMDR